MSVTLYILEFILCSAIFVALYKLFIEARVSHRYSRIYLVWSMIFSAVVPLLELPLYPAQTVYYELPIITYEQPEIMPVAAEPMPKVDMPATPQPEPVDWALVAAIVAASIYGLIVLLNLARFAWRLWIIRKLRNRCELTIYEAYTLAMSDQISEPFSFWRTIYMNRRFQGREQQQIITHELSHVRHHHTAERLMLEFMRCIFWFNPFVWISGTLLVQVQEWQADRDVIDAGYDVYEYRQSIFRQLYGLGPDVDLVNGLYRNLTKKRFIMMTNINKGRFSLVRMCAVVPVMVAMIFAFGAVRAEDKIIYSNPSESVGSELAADALGLNDATTYIGGAMSASKERTFDAEVPKSPEQSQTQPQQPQPQTPKREVKGQVLNEKGKPLAGVYVLVSNSHNGAMTDENGQFSGLLVDDSDVLEFSHLSYRHQNISAKGESQFSVVLKPKESRMMVTTLISY